MPYLFFLLTWASSPQPTWAPPGAAAAPAQAAATSARPLLLFPRGHPAAPPASDPLLPSSSLGPHLSLSCSREGMATRASTASPPPSYKGAPGPSLGFLLAFPFLPCAAASRERFPKPSSFSCAPWPPRVQAHRRPSSRRRWLSSSCPRTSTRRPESIQTPSRARGLHPQRPLLPLLHLLHRQQIAPSSSTHCRRPHPSPATISCLRVRTYNRLPL